MTARPKNTPLTRVHLVMHHLPSSRLSPSRRWIGLCCALVLLPACALPFADLEIMEPDQPPLVIIDDDQDEPDAPRDLFDTEMTSPDPPDMTPDLPHDADSDMRDMMTLPDMLDPEMPERFFGMLISEVIEGAGENKALEIYNHSAFDHTRTNVYVRVTNNNTTTDFLLPPIPSLTTYTICNPAAINIPNSNCTTRNLASTNFNGDDAIFIYEDTDNNQQYSPGVDLIIDAFGHPNMLPRTPIWENDGFQRCNFRPYTANRPFDDAEFYIRTNNPSDFSNLGIPPIQSCINN